MIFPGEKGFSGLNQIRSDLTSPHLFPSKRYEYTSSRISSLKITYCKAGFELHIDGHGIGNSNTINHVRHEIWYI